jgi:predicted ATPase
MDITPQADNVGNVAAPDVEDMPLLKIGFIGTGGTGKTSVAEILSSLIPETFQPSIVRDVMAAFNVTDATQSSLSVDDKWAIQRALLDAKFEQDDMYEVGLFDRTPIDHMAYTLYRCADALADEVFHELSGRVQEFIEQYDLIFYFPVYDWPAEDDGFRQQNLAYRATHDIIIRGLMEKFDLEFIEMPDAPVEERVALMIDLINDERDAVWANEDDDGEEGIQAELDRTHVPDTDTATTTNGASKEVA